MLGAGVCSSIDIACAAAQLVASPGSCDWYSLAGGVLKVLKSPVSTVQLFEVLVSTSPLGTGAGVLAWQGLPSGRERH